MTARLTWLRDPRAPVVAFAGLVVIAFGLILDEGRGVGFGGDQWDFMLTRQGIAPPTHGSQLAGTRGATACRAAA